MISRNTSMALGALVALTMGQGLPLAANADAPDLEATTVVDGLENPWDMAFLADGTLFFTEKCKGLSVRLPSGDINALLGMEGTEGYAHTADDLFCHGQAGMNGVAMDPEFEDNRFVYVYSASQQTTPHKNRVIRLRVNEDFTDVSDRTDIVDDIPYKQNETNHPFGDAGAHNGGRIRFNPGDGYLYVTTGDNHNAEVPQSPTLLGGKVLRIDRDGNAAPENDPPEGFDDRIYTYGHRNVQGISFHPETHRPFITEHGPWHSDELMALENGGNSGWDPKPNVGGRGDCPDDYCGYMPNQMEGMDPAERREFMPMTDTERFPDAMRPAWNNDGLSQGISSAQFLSGSQWGDWENRLVVGFMGIGFGGTPVGQRLDVVDVADDAMSVDVTTMALPMPAGRFRSVVQGPEGDLWVAVDEGRIHRISPN
ncbi:PQQ-dependent sugar dehydrogenase [Spiribacter halobius]|uniref:Aldose sugar dehydrogenase n=1 Tax=Sediminicurvatus halobius TaxID=2182432 RepID=A0A2U2N4Z6_9GAMM|nr:PQQ-dependent sugar dehydrogenase [Spiribacter halobius]PWG64039.1 aldose sugar dehydrogenase [Spiribacter halobius]UEX76906.1 PQQ-dependent sugar dehydrogenase [Spiribacter halobius]